MKDQYFGDITALQEGLEPQCVFSFKTPQVVFPLASQARHVSSSERQIIEVLLPRWLPKEIFAKEHRPTDRGCPPNAISDRVV